jgi:hypothetical protein
MTTIDDVQRPMRAVETVYNLTKLNRAIKSGAKYEVHLLKKSPKLFTTQMLLRNIETGEIVEAPSRAHATRMFGMILYPEAEWELVHQFKRYARERKNTVVWGAYIIPRDVIVGERFQISDPLVDVFLQDFWGEKVYAEEIVATWDGERLVLDRDSLHYDGLVG